MGKNKSKNKAKQQQKPLIVAKPVIAVPTIAAPTIPIAPIANPKPVMVAPQINVPIVAPKIEVPIPKPVAVAPVTTTGTLEGTIVSRTYHSKTGAVVYGRIYCPSTDKYYVAHSLNGIVPIESSLVSFDEYIHERANGQKTTAARNITVIGTNSLTAARMETINSLPVYEIMRMEDFLNMSGEATELANIIGSTPEGELLIYIKDKRK